MRFIKLLIRIVFILPILTIAQTQISAVATKASCTGSGKADGSIHITVTNVSHPITHYAVAKAPFDAANIIVDTDPLITHLEAGDYFYGYYEGNTFIRAASTINIESSYSPISPTISNFSAQNYTYCASEPNPLGRITVSVDKGNPPYTINLLNAANNSIVKSITLNNGYTEFTGIASGSYKVNAIDQCGTLVSPAAVVNLAPNVELKDFDFPKGNIGNVEITYNSPGDACSGISSATLPDGLLAVSSTSAYINTVPRFSGTQNFVYKLEIQNGSDWDVHDNLTLSDVKKRYQMPADRSKWGLVRISATYCNITKIIEQDYGSSNIGRPISFTNFQFSIEDDPTNTNCNLSGKVTLKNIAINQGGCLPYKVDVTENGTTVTNTYTITSINDLTICLLDIDKRYTVKVTDNSGTEAGNYSFKNNTSNTSTSKPNITDSKNVFIDKNRFSPDDDIKNKIVFYTGPSGKFFNRSALGLSLPIATSVKLGLEGVITISLISGPSPLVIRQDGEFFALGNRLLPGTYKVRIQDSGCFNEEFEVVLDSYFTKIEITKVDYTASQTICDRYIKNVTVEVSAVGTGTINATLTRLYGGDYINPGIFSAPPGLRSYTTVSTGGALRRGTFNFSFRPEISGNYSIGISRTYVPDRLLLLNELFENTSPVPLVVNPNFPSFNLSKSGGVICSGNTTGNLYVQVDNVIGNVTYFIKKDTDADFPTTGQSSSVFTGLSAGNYIIKAKTDCYEVLQPFILRNPFETIISGNNTICKGENIKLSLTQIGPINSIKWTLPDGSHLYTTEINIINPTAAQSGIYTVEVNSLAGCNFTESINVTISDSSAPTGSTTQEFCTNSKATVADLVVNETGVVWYDAITGGKIIPENTILENGKTYYGVLQLGKCQSSSRLAVTVTLNDPATPTGNAIQEFCLSDNPKVSDLKTNENTVVWYDAPVLGNVIPDGTALVDQKIYYGNIKTGTCESSVRLAVTVIVKNDIEDILPDWSTTACNSEEITYAVTTGMSNYNWNISPEGKVINGGNTTDNFVTILWKNTGNASIMVNYIDLDRCDPLVTINFPLTITSCLDSVYLPDIGLRKMVNNPIVSSGKYVAFIISADNLGTNDFDDVLISEILPSGYEYKNSTVSSGNYDPNIGIWTIPLLLANKTETLTITAKVKETGDYLNVVELKDSNPTDSNPENNKAEASIKFAEIVVHDAVSPNGDGLNDYLKITGLEYFPDNTIEIFNPWGAKVFETSKYDNVTNAFRGVSNVKMTLNKNNGLPSGTYFYILRYKVASVMVDKSGYIYINN